MKFPAPFLLPIPLSVHHYKNILQQGHGIPWENHSQIYRGRRGQRGFGIFGSLFKVFKSVIKPIARNLLPVAKNIGRTAVSHALEAGKDILLDGQKPREVLRKRGRQLFSDVVQKNILQKGKGRKRKRGRPKVINLDDQEIWTPSTRKKRRVLSRRQIQLPII